MVLGNEIRRIRVVFDKTPIAIGFEAVILTSKGLREHLYGPVYALLRAALS